MNEIIPILVGAFTPICIRVYLKIKREYEYWKAYKKMRQIRIE